MKAIRNVPHIEIVKSALVKWAEINQRILKVYLFGSYVTKAKDTPSDIDVAIEISDLDNDTASGFWCSEGSKMERQLNAILNYKIDLEWFDKKETPIIKGALKAGSIVIYEKK